MSELDYVGFDERNHAITIGCAIPSVLRDMAQSPRVKWVAKMPVDEAVRLHRLYLATLPQFAGIEVIEPGRQE